MDRGEDFHLFWHLEIRPPYQFGSVPNECYDRITALAASKGFVAVHERVRHARQVGSFQTEETFLRPAGKD